MDDLLTEFLTETGENLAVLDVELVKFEQDPSDKDILSNIFRLVHTIKGTCGFLGLPRLEKVAHAGEDVLGNIRDGKLDVTPEAVTLILQCLDRIRDLLGELEETGEEPDGEDSELIALLRAMADGESAPPPSIDPIVEAAPADSGPEANEFGAPVAAEFMAEFEAASAKVGGSVSGTNEFGAPVAAELLEEVAKAESSGAKAASDAEIIADLEEEDNAAAAEKAKADASVPAPVTSASTAVEKKAEPTKKKDAGEKGPSVAAQSIRVNVDLLENLMTLVSEMVLTRNQLLQMVRGRDDSEFSAPLQRLSMITTELQEGVMKTRMQPIGNAWAKLPRIVRDLSVDSGKKIDLQMLGADTELDRQVLEMIKDPLTHMVRNSADHGLEEPDDRVAAGKAELGTITLNAYHEGGHIVISISDDGRGLNTDRIRQKAIENELATEAEIDGMADAQIHQFVMKAGFSTAEKITSVSGRGVGMDVVRSNIEKIGGTVELKSEEGKGSTFTIKIPLTLAIVSALVVECASQRFAIPQISVLELVRAASRTETAIEMINDSPVLRLRDRLLPLVALRDLLNLSSDEQEVEASTVPVDDGAEAALESEAEQEPEELDDEVFIVVSQVGNYSFGIIVDRVFDTEEIVVKPVTPILRDIPYYSGNTILGDGSVIMIIDPNGIAGDAAQSAPTEAAEAHAAVDASDETTSMLIFRAGGDELKAVPLALVARLEEIDMDTVEQSQNQRMVQYRGSLMPLIPYNEAHEWKEGDRQPILVFTDQERSMGLAVDEIVDIVEDRLNIEISTDLDELIGSAVIDGKATDVINAGHFLTKAYPDWFEIADRGFEETSPPSVSILLVDDSPFFRNLLTPMLSVAGYVVTSVESADDALELRESGNNFDVIISDIEMPGMNGFEFAEEVRRDARWKDTPMVALSSHVVEKDLERGREVGFDDYVTKSDRDELIQTLESALNALGES
jgi:two-component system, chemotaxis family, sensor kinase CheA